MSNTQPNNPATLPAESDVVTAVASSSSALEQINRAEIDVQISTAKAFPRSVSHFLAEVREMITYDEETAASMQYVLPARKGSTERIKGASVRLAEAMVCAWGNFRYGGRVISIDDKAVVAMGFAHDVEKNVYHATEIRRRIVDKYGRRYSDDMITTTSMAAIAIAKRNAVLSVIPRFYADRLLAEAEVVALGKGLTMEQRRKRCVEEFARLGVKEKDVLRIAGVGGIDDLGNEELSVMLGIRTALKDHEGGLTVQSLLASLDEPAAAPVPVDVTKMFPEGAKTAVDEAPAKK